MNTDTRPASTTIIMFVVAFVMATGTVQPVHAQDPGTIIDVGHIIETRQAVQDIITNPVTRATPNPHVERYQQLQTRTKQQPQLWRWIPWIVAEFEPRDHTDALSVMWCESRGNETADASPRSSAHGLFQFINETWNTANSKLGGGLNRSHGPDNIKAAAWLVKRSRTQRIGAWRHWQCKP